jgi:hypothetical protein
MLGALRYVDGFIRDGGRLVERIARGEGLSRLVRGSPAEEGAWRHAALAAAKVPALFTATPAICLPALHVFMANVAGSFPKLTDARR